MATTTKTDDTGTAPRHERVPDLLLDERKPGESMKEYRIRRKANQKMVDEYLRGDPKEHVTPSSRIRRRLVQGKRTFGGLKEREINYLLLTNNLEDKAELREFIHKRREGGKSYREVLVEIFAKRAEGNEAGD